jgi:hypothetical protein
LAITNDGTHRVAAVSTDEALKLDALPKGPRQGIHSQAPHALVMPFARARRWRPGSTQPKSPPQVRGAVAHDQDVWQAVDVPREPNRVGKALHRSNTSEAIRVDNRRIKLGGSVQPQCAAGPRVHARIVLQHDNGIHRGVERAPT